MLSKIVSDFGEKETEQNWEKIEEGLKKAAEIVSVQPAETVINGLKKIRGPLTSSVRLFFLILLASLYRY